MILSPRLGRMNQGGIILQVYNEAAEYIAINVLGSVVPSVKQKYTNRIELSNPDLVPISMENLNLLKSIIFNLFFTSFFVLSFEKFYIFIEQIIA